MKIIKHSGIVAAAATVAILGLTSGCQQNSAAWAQFAQSTVDEYYSMNPNLAVDAGLHQYDGMVPDMSQEAIRQRSAWLTAKRETARSFADADLSKSQRFEKQHLLAVIDGFLFWLEEARWPAVNPVFYAGAIDPGPYVTRDYAPLAQRMIAFTSMAAKVPLLVEQAIGNLEPPLPRTYIAMGRIAFGGLASFFEDDVPAVFAAVDDPALQQAFSDSVQVAVAALHQFDDYLQDLETTATDDFALGAERYKAMLWRTSRVDILLDNLEAAGRADLARNQAALESACEALTPEGSITDCIDLVMNDKPSDGAVEEARRQLAGLKALVISEKLVSIPGTQEALVDISPPFMRWNSAFISIPGPFEQGLPSIYYISPPDPSWSPEDQLAYVPGKMDLMFISVHEVWPGHFLHFLHSNQTESVIGRAFSNYAFTEGWAHYSEELMWEAGLGDGDPATQIGQLLNALLRNVRFLVSIGMHTQGMTVAQAETMFMEQAYQDPGNARQQAARGTFDPGFLNYTLGKLMIRQLRTEWTASRGGRAAWQKFHDEFLSYGAPPIALVRQSMLGDDAGPALQLP
ncbi:MAG: DUF885 domain-containing protein [Candidatus Marinimicrobia bacterium]|nr:DUF885 domain-containing protein [Candidatus Neomarinimicrobiota bacterium]